MVYIIGDEKFSSASAVDKYLTETLKDLKVGDKIDTTHACFTTLRWIYDFYDYKFRLGDLHYFIVYENEYKKRQIDAMHYGCRSGTISINFYEVLKCNRTK